jgi:hypothetical protein
VRTEKPVKVVQKTESSGYDIGRTGELEQQQSEASWNIGRRDDRHEGYAPGKRQGCDKSSNVALARGSDTVTKKSASA